MSDNMISDDMLESIFDDIRKLQGLERLPNPVGLRLATLLHHIITKQVLVFRQQFAEAVDAADPFDVAPAVDLSKARRFSDVMRLDVDSADATVAELAKLLSDLDVGSVNGLDAHRWICALLDAMVFDGFATKSGELTGPAKGHIYMEIDLAKAAVLKLVHQLAAERPTVNFRRVIRRRAEVGNLDGDGFTIRALDAC